MNSVIKIAINVKINLKFRNENECWPKQNTYSFWGKKSGSWCCDIDRLPNQNQFKIFYRFFMKKWINFSTEKTDTKSFFVSENVIIWAEQKREIPQKNCWSLFSFSDLNIFSLQQKKLFKQKGKIKKKIYSWFSRRVTVRGSCTGLVTVGPTKV